jgi:hypothetical protein
MLFGDKPQARACPGAFQSGAMNGDVCLMVSTGLLRPGDRVLAAGDFLAPGATDMSVGATVLPDAGQEMAPA